MSFQFQPDETSSDGVRRIALEQVQKAIEELRSQEMDPHEAVHEARKRFKKVRALLRLVREPMGKQYRLENGIFRDFGRTLSVYRDAEAVVETFDALRREYDVQTEGALGEETRKLLVARRDQLAPSGAAMGDHLAGVADALELSLAHVAAWPLEKRGFGLLRRGFRTIYQQGAQAMKDAAQSGAAEDFHEWRKRVKDHGYHLQLLTPVWPEVLRAHRRGVYDLAEVLGDHHNLVVFEELLRQERELVAEEHRQTLLCLVEQRKGQLEADALALGRNVFVEAPKALTKRVGNYWKNWRE